MCVSADTYILSYQDLKADVVNAYGLQSEQYSKGIELAVKLSTAVENMTIVGHSLGGGIASEAALATGRSAHTFNAASTGRKNSPRAKSLIKAYYAPTDPLTIAQDFNVLRRAFGWKAPSLKPSIGARIKVSGARFHSIDSMYDALN